ncbi:hypothetical protein NL533_31555, partial [Klebsiella pneumoniae]|nr:hypothetical protein [Klebsiella pneumoniae]
TNDLFAADEIFTANSVTKVLPVRRFENRELSAPGPVTRKLMNVMDDILQFKNRQFARFFEPL